MKHIFIVNPAAGEKDITEALKTQLEKTDMNTDYELYITSFPGDAAAFIKKTLQENNDEYRFYSCGGDGTLNEVVNGVIGFDNASVTVVPCGSGNDFIKYYGTADDFSDIKTLISAPSQKIDALKINGRYAINAVHFGLDSYVLKTMLKVRRNKLFGGKNAYPTGVLAGFICGMKTFCRIKADGISLGNGKILLCTLANGKYVGGSYKCAPRSLNNDGLIEVCQANTVPRLKFLCLMNIYKRGGHLEDRRFKKYLNYMRARKIEVFSDKEIPVSIDGELVFTKDFTVEIEKSAINFAVPAKLLKNAGEKADYTYK